MAIRLPERFLRGLLRGAVKPLLGPPFGFSFQRVWARLASNVNPVSRDASTERVDVAGMEALRAFPKEGAVRRVILYLHGGGYCIGSWKTQAGLVTHLATAARADVFAPDYRLAPEDPHPAALEDALSAYRWVLAKGISPDRLVLAGDSAGGGLALATAIAARDQGLPKPASLVLVSPWVDLQANAPAMTERASVDPMLRPSWLRACAAASLDGRDPRDPACSPLYAQLNDLPPTLIQTGTDEIIVDDSTRLAERLRRAKTPVTLRTFDGLWHEFQIHAGILDAADRAVADIARFLNAIQEGASVELEQGTPNAAST